MAKISSDTVGRAFVEQYYNHLHIKPEGSFGFYKSSSLASWDTEDCVTTLKGIHEMIMSSDFKDCTFEIEDIRTQDSLEETILVVVTGISMREMLRRKFCQTFVLAKHGKGFFVLNDILHFVNEGEDEVPTELATKEEAPDVNEKVAVEKTQQALSQEEELIEQEEELIEQEEELIEEASSKTTEETVSEVVEVLKEDVPKVVEVEAVSKVNEEVNDDVQKAAPKSSYLEMVSKGKMGSTPAPATRFVIVSPLDGLPEEEKTKILARQNGSGKALASEPKPETPRASNSAPENNGPKGIYVGGMLPDTTVDDLASAVKIFGLVKKFDGVQVIRSDDRFCFGFVHFQSADSAKKAVEAQVIAVKGKEAYITYKRSSRRAAYGNANRGRSPCGSQSGTPSGRGGSHSRTPSSRAPSCNGGSKNSEIHNNDGNVSADGGDNGETDGWVSVQRRRQRGRNGYAYQRNSNDQRAVDQRLRNGKMYSENGPDRRMRNGVHNEQRQRNGAGPRSEK